jgi:hypothetical protein
MGNDAQKTDSSRIEQVRQAAGAALYEDVYQSLRRSENCVNRDSAEQRTALPAAFPRLELISETGDKEGATTNSNSILLP